MMKAMRDEMQKDLDEARSIEAEDATAYGEMKDSKEAHLGILMKTLSDKHKRSGELALSISEDKDALEDANTELTNAQKYLATLTEACEQRRKDRDMRNKMRNDEIAAISEAIKILTDDDALETFKKAVPSAALVQQKPVKVFEWDAFLQTSQSRTGLHHSLRMRLTSATKAMSRTHRVQLNKGLPGTPSAAQESGTQAMKVVDFMIDNMVETLHEDDVNDEHKKDFCANETTVMEQLKVDKTVLTETLTKNIAEMDNMLKQLAEDIESLKMEINELDTEVRDSMVVRKKEHEDFLVSYQGMDTAVKLVKKATARLQKFYNPSMTAGLVQTSNAQPHWSQPAGPSPEAVRRLTNGLDLDSFIQLNSNTHLDGQRASVDPVVLPDTPKTYEKKESGGVVGLMNDMVAEVTNDMKAAETEEKFAARDYVKLMKESKESRAGMVKQLKEKMLVKAETEEKRMQANQKNELTIEELKHLELYLVQLHAECDFLLRNFENRHDARVDEEHGLDSAESIVTKEEVPMHGAIDNVYEQEHTKSEVEAHFPDAKIPIEQHEI